MDTTKQKLTPNEIIVEKYRLQHLASKIAWGGGKNLNMKYPSNFHKVSKCRSVRYRSDNVNILRSKEHGTTHYGGLVVCASSWVCPVCAPLMQSRRAERVLKAFEWTYDVANRDGAISLSKAEYKRREEEDQQALEMEFNGEKMKKQKRMFMPSPDLLSKKLKAVMLTLTTPHNAKQKVTTIFEPFVESARYMKSGRKWQDFKKELGFVGEICATELKFGSNGPHLHRHIIMIVEDKGKEYDDMTEHQIKTYMHTYWGAGLQKHGLLDKEGSKEYSAFLQYGVDVIPRANSSDYLSKQGREFAWGADDEMTKQSKKTGSTKDRGMYNLKSRTPFEVLSDSENNTMDRAIFLDYIQGTRGRAQLTFSAGLKKLVGLDSEASDDQEDEKDAQAGDDPADLLASLTDDDWKLVVKSKSRGLLLTSAQESGAEGIEKFLENLRSSEDSYRDTKGRKLESLDVLFDRYFDKLVLIYNEKGKKEGQFEANAFESMFLDIDPIQAKNNPSLKGFYCDSNASMLRYLESTDV